jgi:hypothetical protein
VPAGSLTVVGTGITAGSHLTGEARAALERADRVLYLVSDPISAAVIEGLNSNCRSLDGLYVEGASREDIYAAVVVEILQAVRAGERVCVAFYGHPAVFVRPGLEAVREARREGQEARILPAVSALDCLFTDLEIDPADTGLQIYEATDFLARGSTPDTTAGLVLWQISVIGLERWYPEPSVTGMGALVERLLRFFPAEHEVVVYEASPYPLIRPSVDRVRLDRLGEVRPSPMATLYVPPIAPSASLADV